MDALSDASAYGRSREKVCPDVLCARRGRPFCICHACSREGAEAAPERRIFTSGAEAAEAPSKNAAVKKRHQYPLFNITDIFTDFRR